MQGSWVYIGISCIVLTLFCLSPARAQERDTFYLLDRMIIENDTLPHKELLPVFVFPRHKKFKSRRYEKKFWRMVHRVRKVYPYALKASELLADYDEKYRQSNDKKARKKYLKEAEKELMSRYGKELKKLSISEGRLLVKLIDRETGSTSYQLIKEIKGGVSAFFWQGIARLFGHNLKTNYDPKGEDIVVEEIIYLINVGVL